ncbi:hypothetical protein IWW34DRAFT_767575, partial [Fusarium oxysporum f. sp. albedinis]
MWGISVFQDLYFSLVLAFRAGKKNKTRSAVSYKSNTTPHNILADRRRIMLMCALTATTTFYCLILNPSPRSSGQPATSNANVSPLLMRG